MERIMADLPTLFTFRQFAERHPAFSVSSLRWLRFRSAPVKRTRRGNGGEVEVENLAPNGFAAAFVEVGGRVLLDEQRFFEIIAQQNSEAS
jgi:hypothetical protein